MRIPSKRLDFKLMLITGRTSALMCITGDNLLSLRFGFVGILAVGRSIGSMLGIQIASPFRGSPKQMCSCAVKLATYAAL